MRGSCRIHVIVSALALMVIVAHAFFPSMQWAGVDMSECQNGVSMPCSSGMDGMASSGDCAMNCAPALTAAVPAPAFSAGICGIEFPRTETALAGRSVPPETAPPIAA